MWPIPWRIWCYLLYPPRLIWQMYWSFFVTENTTPLDEHGRRRRRLLSVWFCSSLWWAWWEHQLTTFLWFNGTIWWFNVGVLPDNYIILKILTPKVHNKNCILIKCYCAIYVFRNTVIIKFKSDSSVTGTGFSLNYDSKGAGGTNGKMRPYQNNWKITLYKNHIQYFYNLVQINILNILFQLCLRVYDAENQPYYRNKLGSLTGRKWDQTAFPGRLVSYVTKEIKNCTFGKKYWLPALKSPRHAYLVTLNTCQQWIIACPRLEEFFSAVFQR